MKPSAPVTRNLIWPPLPELLVSSRHHIVSLISQPRRALSAPRHFRWSRQQGSESLFENARVEIVVGYALIDSPVLEEWHMQVGVIDRSGIGDVFELIVFFLVLPGPEQRPVALGSNSMVAQPAPWSPTMISTSRKTWGSSKDRASRKTLSKPCPPAAEKTSPG